MQLRVSILNKTYTLNHSRDYIVGIGEDCDLSLGGIEDPPIDYLRLSYDQDQGVWRAFEINTRCQMTVNGQRKSQSLIKAESSIGVDGRFLLIATPEGGLQAQPTTAMLASQNRLKDSGLTRNLTSPATIESTAQPIPVINLGLRWFKISSPSDGVGIWLHPFDLYQTYSVDRNHLGQICEKLYQRVYQAVSDGSLDNAKVRFVIYKKLNFLQEDTRKYLLVTRDTIHGSRTTILVRFLGYGDNLYVGIDVFSLGRINWLTFLLRILLTSVLFSFLMFIIPAFLIALLWWKIFWRMSYEKRFWLALRQEHPGKIGIGPFDDDDVIMFSKSTLHLAVRAIRDVFSEEDLPIESLDRFIQNINNTTIVNKIDNRGGTMGQNTINVNNNK
jgi:hypothetical protein